MPETKGITIEFYGKDLNLQNTIKDINNGLKSTRTQLTDFKNQLKIDPKNLDALKGKFRMLQQEEKLLQEKAQYFREELSKLGETEIGSEKWNAYDRQLKNTEKQILAVKNQLEKMGDVESMTEITNEAEKMGDSFKEASDGALKFGDVLKAEVLGQAIIEGVKALANAIKDIAKELNQWADGYRELEVYEKQFENNIRNTADATDDEIDSLKKLARQKERNGVISKRAITSGFQELATYVESTDAIEGLTNALVDMSAQQYGVDATEESVRNIATTLGKALANGDYSGLTRLGYGFTEAQQRIMKYGDELDRVAVLNDVIESSIGGMNEALAQTDAGKVFEMKTYFDDVKTSIGEVVSELEVGFVEKIMPILQPIIDNFLKWIIDHKDEMLEIVQNIVEWLTSDEAKEFFESFKELVEQIGDAIELLVEVERELGLVKTAIDLVKGAVDLLAGALTIVLNLFSQIKSIASSMGEFFNKGVDFSGISRYYNGSGGYGSGGGAYSSGGYASGGITLNASFNVNSNNVTRMDVEQWASWLADGINEQLGNRIM